MKKFLTICFIALSIVVNAQKSEIEETISNATASAKAGNKKEAITEIENLYKGNPNEIKVILGYINVMMITDNIGDALNAANKGLAQFPSNPELLFSRGAIYNAKGDFNKAIKDFDQALQEKSTIEEKIYLNRGVSYEGLNKFDEAITEFEKAIELKPNNSAAFYKRGVINYKLGKYDEAIDDFDQVVQIEDNNAIAYFNRGMAYYKTNKKNEACIDFRKACQLKHNQACKLVISECSQIK